MKVEIIRELPDSSTGAKRILVRKNWRYYVVSSVSVLGIPETLVFRSDNQGNVRHYNEVVGGRYMTREEAINQLELYV